MPKAKGNHQASEVTQGVATYIAMVVRNAMEDFHCSYLSDKQMKELNPIIRDGIFTALHALENSRHSTMAREFVNMTQRMIPGYWEKPKLLDDYLNLERHLAKRKTPRCAAKQSNRGEEGGL